MARKREVVRTFHVTRCTLMCVNTETAEVFNDTIEVSKLPSDDRKKLTLVRELYSDSHKDSEVVRIVDETIVDIKRAMDEQFYIQNSRIVNSDDSTEEED